jgi:hypothetical protein
MLKLLKGGWLSQRQLNRRIPVLLIDGRIYNVRPIGMVSLGPERHEVSAGV